MPETKSHYPATGNSIFPTRIVGSFYRPPASAIINAIPIGTPLELRAEPTNHVDPNAIAVWIKTEDIPEACLRAIILAGAGCGFRIGEDPAENTEAFLASILTVPEWHLGYIPAVVAKTHTARSAISNGPVRGTFLLVEDKPAITQAAT